MVRLVRSCRDGTAYETRVQNLILVMACDPKRTDTVSGGMTRGHVVINLHKIENFKPSWERLLGALNVGDNGL